MHDYSPLAVFAFVALTIASAVALMFVLAWLEPAGPAEQTHTAVGRRLAEVREIRVRPVSLVPKPSSKPIMKVGSRGAATG